MNKLVKGLFVASMLVTPVTGALQPVMVMAEEANAGEVVKPEYYTAENTIENYVYSLADYTWSEETYSDIENTIALINQDAEVQELSAKMNALDEEIAPLQKDSSEKHNAWIKLDNQYTVKTASWQEQRKTLIKDIDVIYTALNTEAEKLSEITDEAWKKSQEASDIYWAAHNAYYGASDEVDEAEKEALKTAMEEAEVKADEAYQAYEEANSKSDAAWKKAYAANNFKSTVEWLEENGVTNFDEFASVDAELAEQATVLATEWNQEFKSLYESKWEAYDAFMKANDKLQIPYAQMNLYRDELEDYLKANYPALIPADGTDTEDGDTGSDNTKPGTDTGANKPNKKPGGFSWSSVANSVSTAVSSNPAGYIIGLASAGLAAAGLIRFKKKK